MTETRDPKTGITRHEYSTVTPDLCRKYVEQLDCITHTYHGNNVHRYLAEYNDSPIELRATPTRLIMFSPNRYALLEVAKNLHTDEWEYDNTTPRTDYIGGAR